MTANQKGLSMGRELLEKEANIVRLIQDNRYFCSALEKLLSHSEQRRLKRKSKFTIINVDEFNNKNEADEDGNISSSFAQDLEVAEGSINISCRSDHRLRGEQDTNRSNFDLATDRGPFGVTKSTKKLTDPNFRPLLEPAESTNDSKPKPRNDSSVTADKEILRHHSKLRHVKPAKQSHRMESPHKE